MSFAGNSLCAGIRLSPFFTYRYLLILSKFPELGIIIIIFISLMSILKFREVQALAQMGIQAD